jgi:hypothetical protein
LGGEVILILQIAAGIVLGFWIVANWSRLPGYLLLMLKAAAFLLPAGVAVVLFVYAYNSQSNYAEPAGILGAIIIFAILALYRDGNGQPVFNHWRYAIPLVVLIAIRAAWVLAAHH